jgi:hypothetical protein
MKSRCTLALSALALAAGAATSAHAAPSDPFRFTGTITPNGGVDFNDPYRLTRRPVTYRVELSLVRDGNRLGGTLTLSDNQTTERFAVSGRTDGDLDCNFSAGPLRFDGLCASEGIVGQGSLRNMPATIELRGDTMRGEWFAAAQGMALSGGTVADLPQARCLLPDLKVSAAAPAEAGLRSALDASGRFAASARSNDTAAFRRRADLLSALEPSSYELTQVFKTFDNQQRMARRGIFNPRAMQIGAANRDAVLNSPQRQQARAALPGVMAAIAETRSPARRQQAERLAREAAGAFAAWDRALSAAATTLPSDNAGVREAMRLNQAIPGIEACSDALAPFGAARSGLRASLAGQVDRLAPVVVAAIDEARVKESLSESLARQIDTVRGTDLFASRPDVQAAFARADAKVKSLAAAEAEARRRVAAAAQAEQAARRRQGYLTAEDLMEAFLTELDDITTFGERTGNVIRVSAPFLPGLTGYLGGEISNVSCTPGTGQSTCTYELRYWMNSFGLTIPAMLVPARRTDVFTTTGGIRSDGLRQFLIAMQNAAPSPSRNSGYTSNDPQKSMCQSLGAGIVAGGGDMNNSVGSLYRSWC